MFTFSLCFTLKNMGLDRNRDESNSISAKKKRKKLKKNTLFKNELHIIAEAESCSKPRLLGITSESQYCKGHLFILNSYNYLVTLPIKTLVKQILKQATTSQAHWNMEDKDNTTDCSETGAGRGRQSKNLSALYTAASANLLNFATFRICTATGEKDAFTGKRKGAFQRQWDAFTMQMKHSSQEWVTTWQQAWLYLVAWTWVFVQMCPSAINAPKDIWQRITVHRIFFKCLKWNMNFWETEFNELI